MRRRFLWLGLVAGVVLGGSLGAQDAPKGSGAKAAGVGDPKGSGAGKEQAAPAASKKLPDGVLARVNGRDITVDEYVNYLLASIGRSRLDEYVNRLLVDNAASAEDVSVQPDDVEAVLNERVNRTVRSLYQGNTKAYEKNLARRRRTLEEEKARLRIEVYYEMVVRQLVLKRRRVTSEGVRRAFEQTYGKGGVKLVLQHICVSKRPVLGRAAGTGGVREAGVRKVRTPQEARRRAEQIRAEIRGGLDFAEAARKYSDDWLTPGKGGQPHGYHAGRYGAAFDAAVQKLASTNPLSPVVETPAGFYIIRLVEKKVTRFADVEKKVREKLENAAVSTAERQALLVELRKKANVEGLESTP